MEMELIAQHGKATGLSGARLKRYIYFFSMRFPEESNEIHSVANQWAIRFRDDPAKYMHEKSQKVYFGYIEFIQNAEVNYSEQLQYMSTIGSLSEYYVEVDKLTRLFELKCMSNFLEVLANAN